MRELNLKNVRVGKSSSRAARRELFKYHNSSWAPSYDRIESTAWIQNSIFDPVDSVGWISFSGAMGLAKKKN